MSLRTKLLIIVAVIGLAVWAFVPPSQKINLGLDLKGGVHLVLRVHTDDALKLETETTSDRLREALQAASPADASAHAAAAHGPDLLTPALLALVLVARLLLPWGSAS